MIRYENEFMQTTVTEKSSGGKSVIEIFSESRPEIAFKAGDTHLDGEAIKHP